MSTQNTLIYFGSMKLFQITKKNQGYNTIFSFLAPVSYIGKYKNMLFMSTQNMVNWFGSMELFQITKKHAMRLSSALPGTSILQQEV